MTHVYYVDYTAAVQTHRQKKAQIPNSAASRDWQLSVLISAQNRSHVYNCMYIVIHIVMIVVLYKIHFSFFLSLFWDFAAEIASSS